MAVGNSLKRVHPCFADKTIIKFRNENRAETTRQQKNNKQLLWSTTCSFSSLSIVNSFVLCWSEGKMQFWGVTLYLKKAAIIILNYVLILQEKETNNELIRKIISELIMKENSASWKTGSKGQSLARYLDYLDWSIRTMDVVLNTTVFPFSLLVAVRGVTDCPSGRSSVWRCGRRTAPAWWDTTWQRWTLTPAPQYLRSTARVKERKTQFTCPSGCSDLNVQLMWRLSFIVQPLQNKVNVVCLR